MIRPLRDLGRHAVYDSVFAVRASESLADELADCLADLRADEAAGPATDTLTVSETSGEWSVRWNSEQRYRGPLTHLALYDALIAINQHAAETAVDNGCAVLHGGAVGVAGRGVAFVGHSGAGKSTLTTAMSRCGHVYLADEVVAVEHPHADDADFVVRPFHRPAGLRPLGVDALGVSRPDGPYETIFPYRVSRHGILGGRTPLRLIVLLRRSDVDPTIRPVQPAMALFELSNQTLGGAELKRQMFRRLESLVRRVPVAELHYRNVDEAVPVIEGAVAAARPLGENAERSLTGSTTER